jgi:hypothetical protein
LALSGHSLLHRQRPLLGVKRTWCFAAQMSAYEPKRTWRTSDCGDEAQIKITVMISAEAHCRFKLKI